MKEHSVDSEDNKKPEGQPRGFLDRVRSATPAVITDNAPRVVAALKIMGSTSMLFSKNWAFKIAGAGFITANLIMGTFGKKKSEEEKERLRNEAEKNQKPESDNAIINHLNKVVNPKKYPIESGATIATAASTFWTASGVIGKGGFSPGRLIGGGLSLASDANVAFTKERIDEAGANTHKHGSLDYYMTEMKNRPVLLSSMLNIGCDIASIVGGAHEYSKGKEINTLLAGLFLLSANVFQAVFVNKNDYNIERKAAAPENGLDKQIAKSAPETKKETAWQDRVENQAAQSNLAMQLG